MRSPNQSVIFAIVLTALTAFQCRLDAQRPEEIPQNAIVINLDKSGALRLDQEKIERVRLSDRLHDMAMDGKDTVVVVAARDVAFTDVATTVEVVRSPGIDRVGILMAQPGGSIRETLPPVGATLLSMDRSGVVRLNGKKTKVGDVASSLQKVFKSRADRTVYIQAYGALSFDAVSTVIDAAKTAGAKPIALLASSE
jgi:biopolymer transport protein ExbD